ncbi:MAG: glycosyltransferase [Rhodanobacter sp. 68-29]|uniref:glycosyltransferase n=1 Tax=Rhodanobacter sp. PCA2 TaxID=2006117 RepID=UPI00086CD2B0|nr:glycosyltransferase [Rhodanobacter sp. PCA2]MBA2079826.1 glycosyltransferase [Rhodanobacter sp. PCA2]MBN8924800.1 glycosyltransferase [Rhodanobacter sp.]ODU73121.1 MAG: glycosyltransferase [Rhodanobacter sp. SCN 69-32]OJY58048.1 MAG: glycosyltransferase [Rhodanobacter sp. 68-29]
MNITHVVENLNRGGLERVVIDLVMLQHQQGHRCQVVCLFQRGSLAPELDAAGIPVHACDKGRGIDFGALARVRRLIRDHRTEVLHSHNAVAHYLAVLASVGLDVGKVVNTRHGMGGMQRWNRAEMLYRASLARTDAVAMVCEAACDGALEHRLVPRDKLRVVPNGLRVQEFTVASPAARERLRASLGLPPQTRLVGTVGRLNWAKDQANLIRAFRRVHEQLPDTALVLIGDGGLRGELEACARDEGVAAAVRFLGDRSDVRDLLQGLDVFVLSSVSEGYSMALLEASATALPIVATDVGGNREIVRDGSTGSMVPARDVDALAQAILLLLREPARAARYGTAARAMMEASGSLEAMAVRYAALYEARRSAA